MTSISRSLISFLLLAGTACGSNPVEGVTDSGSTGAAGSDTGSASTSEPTQASITGSSTSSSSTGDTGDVSASTGSSTSGSSTSTEADGSTDVSTSTGSMSSTSTGEASTASVPATSSSTSTGDESSTGDPAPACFGALCSDELPCGDGLVCLEHPYGGPAVCALADCSPGEYCEGAEYACSKHTPQGECIADNSGHGWCHPRACKDGWYCETGECDAGLCY